MPQSTGSEGQQSSNSDIGEANGGGDTGGLDFGGLFEETKQQLEEAKTHSSRMSQELEQVKGHATKSSAELERIKKAIMGGDDETAVDPVEQEVAALEAEMDEYLQAAIQHERAGKPIPLTINSAVKSLKHQIRYVRDNAAKDKELALLRAQVKQVQDPQTNIEHTAYSNIDSQIESALQGIYGQGDQYAQVREAQFRSVSSQIVAEIKDLKKNDPQMWARISRDRKAQVNLVNHFVKQTIPPKARAIMDQQVLMDTPLTNQELEAAFFQAKEKSLKDPDALRQMQEIRTELVGRMLEKNMGGGSKSRMSELYTE